MSLHSIGAAVVCLLLVPACSSPSGGSVPDNDAGSSVALDGAGADPLVVPGSEVGPVGDAPVAMGAGGDARADVLPPKLEVVQVPCEGIVKPTTWKAAVYVFRDCSMGVHDALTIEPGAILKFDSTSYMYVVGDGILNSIGTAAAPVVFTSLQDDAHGGDTNGDGATTQAKKGDWGNADYISGVEGGILLQSTGNQLKYTHVYYALYGVHFMSKADTISNSVFAYSSADGLLFESADETTSLSGNAFYGNEGFPIRLKFDWPRIDASNVFHDPADPAVKNLKQCIDVTGAADITKPISVSNTEVAFYGDIQISSTVTVAPGVTFKSAGASMMLLEGGSMPNASQAIFTSRRDDSHGGDCMGDGPIPPTEHDWNGFSVYSNGAGYSVDAPNVLYAPKQTTEPPKGFPVP